MKTNAKIYFVAGMVTTIGALSLAYVVFKNSDKTPRQFLNDGKRFIKRSVRNGDRMLDETLDNLKGEAQAIIEEAKDLA